MQKTILLLILWAGLVCGSCEKQGTGEGPTPETGPQLVSKTNPTKVYMHYMPWFHSKEFSGYWGIHWRMTNQDPDNVLPNGNREIASHYYPLIGPYDSADPDVIDYHLLLMKYSGVDGILIDWYGTHDVLDYAGNLANSNAVIEGAGRTGLEFAIVYEDFTAEEAAQKSGLTALEAARQDMAYIGQHYFSSGQHIRIGGKPLLLTFGPRHFTEEGQWAQILGELGVTPAFLPLWNHTNRVGVDHAAGEFAWIDFNPSLSGLNGFYQSAGNRLALGSAYPGFHDFYAQGGWGDNYAIIGHQNGETLRKTLDRARAFNLPYLQLATWNDFGEGTMLEPTAEFRFRFLEIVQEFTGVDYRKSELELIYDYYLKRKAYRGDPEAQITLDEVFEALIRLDVATAEGLLSGL